MRKDSFNLGVHFICVHGNTMKYRFGGLYVC